MCRIVTCEHVGLCPSVEVPPGGADVVAGRSSRWTCWWERVAGLDVGMATVVVCVRIPGEGGRRASETRSAR